MYYKFVDLPNIEKIADTLYKRLSVEHKTTTIFQSQSLEVFEKFTALNEAIELIKPRSDIANIAIVTCRANSRGPVHVDELVDKHKSAINFPIYNCKDTYTCFYKILNNAQPNRITQSHGDPYFDYDVKDIEEVDRLYLHKAAVFDTQSPHGVINNTNEPRIILSVRFHTPIDITKL